MAFGDSISGLFAGVFGAIYSDGTLQSYALSDDGSGSVSRTTTSHAIKYQLDQTKARHEREPGIPRGDARVIVLRHNTHEPRNGDALHLGGDVYTIVSVQAAPANTHWTIEAQKNGHVVYVTIYGTCAATDGADTISAGAGALVSGSVSANDGEDTVSGTVGVVVGGVVEATDGSDTVSAAGLVSELGTIVGTASMTDGDDTVGGAGSVAVSGACAATDVGDTLASAAGALIAGTCSATDGADTISATAGVVVTGSCSASEASDTATGVGAVAVSGTASATDSDDALSAAGTVSGDVFDTVWTAILSSTLSGGSNNWTMVTKITSAVVSAPSGSVTKAKVYIKGPVTRAYIGQRASSGDVYDAASLTQILFSGQPGLSQAIGDTTLSDETEFTWDKSSDIIVSLEFNHLSFAYKTGVTGVDAYFKSVLEADVANKSGYSLQSGYAYGVAGLQTNGF